MEEKIVKDGEVEVSSDEAGFEGAWFLGVLEDNYPPKSLQHTKLRVRYLTLVQDDKVSPLIEHVEPRFIRPVPSEDRYMGVVLDQGSMVDAYFKEGWWTGLVLRKLDDGNFSVYFDTPPDIIQFHRNQLRPHLHWNGSDFVSPEIQEVDTSTFSSGSMVEASSTGITWYPATIVKEIEVDGEKKFIVKFPEESEDDDKNQNPSFDSCHVRPVPPPFWVEEYSLMDCVEVLHGLGWDKGSVKEFLGDNSYVVCLESTKEKHVFNHSEIRPCKVWENGVWHDGAMPKPVKGTPSNIDKMKPRRKSRKLGATGELRSADVDMNDNTPPPLQMGKESVTPVTPPSQVSSVSPLKRTKSDTQTLEPVRNNNDNDSTQHKISEDKSRKRKRKEDPKETDDGSNAEINDTSNHTWNDDDDVDGLPLTPWRSVLPNELYLDQSQIVANDTVLVLPFEKTLPFWKSYETHEASSQIPHFSPLFEFKEKEQAREWAAYGMMVGFNRLLEEVKDLQLHASSSKLRSLSCHLNYLEEHGFDVAAPRSRIEKILSFQDVKAKTEEERKLVEEKIEAEDMEIHMFEEEMVELNRKMLELKERKEVAEKRKVEMKSYAETIDQNIEDLELEFKTTPW